MNNREFENKISSAMADMMPKDTYEKITANINSASTYERTRTAMTVKKSNKFIKFVLPGVAACLILVLGVFGFSYYSNNFAVDSIIDIDVNPGIEISTNKNDSVLDVVAVNNDGKEILDGMDLKKTDLKVAVNAIIGSMVQKGYVVDENSGILVTVQNDDNKKALRIRNEIIADIDESLSGYKIDAPVINQTVTKFDSAEQFAKNNNISVGKALFVQSLAAKDSSLKAEELAKMSIKEIVAIVKERNLDIRDIVDYDADDSIWENIADTIDDVNDDVYDDDKDDRYDDDDDKAVTSSKPSTSTSSATTSSASKPTSSTITAEKAKSIALEHAGVAASKVTFIKVELDRDDGVKKYEIEFLSGNIDYEYEINAETGKIIDFEKDIEDDDDRYDD